MTRKVHKIAAYCMIGSLTFMRGVNTAYASTEPVAGITVLLDDISTNAKIQDQEIGDILNPIIKYKDLAIANVSNYVNIRSEASTDSKILGKLYNNGTATILGIEGEWLKIKSGDVTGYIKSEYLITGLQACELADEVKTKLATVKARTLNVRSKADINSSVVTQVPQGDRFEVLAEYEDWIKISLGDKIGYVSSDYVDIKTDFKKAVSIEQEQERLKLEKALKEKNNSTSSNATSSLRQRIVNFALKFKGNPYVWGGTSLTKGADCSGFTQSVFKNFGISIPRTSRAQANSGKRVSMDKIQPGDLIFYTKNGRINHVALYIGNGKVIGAASRKEGITIKAYNYRTPYKAVSYINN
ncbi:SH3 domain-containing protein [Herbinix hemicellulosilytica]|uniref:SH3 domain-containing protein n=1 Tax=Herbinix hemicellulosilytica TaxID=1564487 RepID=A0A0H5SF59_HERHM|nr:SH3 domain-containing C40 family peptidase [Herbinix hemicellulosilytica]RBP60214.1 SH3 domain-containing protein [Herbinix hemicellulosilytica]CRZ33645.1 hypothetical protein HHT355_0440 [Herbinix hemicellulosilytica]